MVESIVESSTEAILNVSWTGKTRVLHVDDDQAFLKVAKQCLEMQGEIDVDTASSVSEASEKLKKSDYDVVVSDYQMPGKDGLEFLKELRKNGNTVPFIVFTGKGREEVIIRALNLGADHYVNKNGDPETVYAELKHAISETVRIRKTESELQESQMRYGKLIENAPDVIYTISENGTLASLNPAFERLTDWKRSEWIGNSFASLIHPDDLNTAMETFEKTLHGECLPPYELRVLSKSGKYLIGEFTSRPWVEKGKIVGEFGIVRDVTGRKKTDETLRKSEEKYRELVENLHEGIWAIDKEAYTTFVNSRMADLLGYTIDEMKGKHLFSFMDECGVELAKNLLKRRQQGIKEQHDFEFTRKDGMRIYATLETTPLSDENGNYIGALASVMDNTERRKMENALRESEEKLRNVFAASPDAITVSDLNGNIVECNQATAALHGYASKEELIGKNSLELIAKKDHKRAIEGLKETLEHGSMKNVEYTFVAKDGREFPAELSASVVMDASGKPEYFMAITKDITERKKMGEEIESLARFPSENPNSVLRVSREGVILYANNPGKALLQDWKNEVVDRAPESLPDVVAETLSSQSEKSFDLRLGKQVYSISVTPVRGSDYANIYGTNITERKKAEEALHESIEGYKELTESISDMFFAMDKDFRYAYWNKASEKLTGISAKDAIGKSLTEVFPDVKGTRVEQFYKEALRTQQPQSYLNKYQLKGKDYVFEINAYPTKTGLSVFVKDVTEREKMDGTLKSAEQKFRGLVEDSAAAIATIDLKGRLTYVNKALADLFGYSIQEMSDHAFKDFLHPDDRGRLVRLFLKIIVLRRQPRKFEFRALRKGGMILHLMCRPTRLETAGKTVGFQAIILDNTAEKRMLERAEKISEKLSVVGGLTRHDVNNKLSAILGVSYLLKQRLHDNQSLELLKEAESAVHQIERLFEFARIYEKLGVEELTCVDVEKVFNEAAMLFPSLQDVKIVNDCHGLTVFADSLLRQLFYNLIDNSLKHGEKVSQVRVHYQTDEDHLKLFYEDDGIGVPKAEKDKIFEEGYGKDAGHGLYLIRRMCEVYGWTIRETGKQGEGAQFTMSILKIGSTGKGDQVQKTQQRQQKSATTMEVPNAHSQPHS